MQKKLIALAVAGLASSAAFAQSNVQIFGTLRPSYDFISAKANDGTKTTVSAMNSNSSTIGFRGSEDLGNGLKAIFSLEYNIDIANDNSTLGSTGTQDMYVGFDHNSWGSLKFGALNNVEKAYFAGYDMFAFSIGDYNNLFTQGVDSRNSGAFLYETPTFNGFKVGFSHALEGVKGENDGLYSGVSKTAGVKTNKAKTSIAADYKLGGLQLTAAFSQGNDERGDGVDRPDAKSQRYGASYTFANKARLLAVYGSDKNFKPGFANDGSHKTWMIGGSYPVTANIDLMADYIKAGDSDTAETGAKNWNLGAKYSLSKRTNVQALYSHLKNDAAGEYGFDSGYEAVGAGSKASAFSVRLQHSF